MFTRRDFLLSTGVATAALAAWPAALLGQELPSVPMPAGDLYDLHQERYWAAVRKQFVIPPGEIYLNNGTVGSSPLPVLKAVFDGYMDAERLAQEDSEDYPIWGYGPFDEIAAWLHDYTAAHDSHERDVSGNSQLDV